jgi:hypothetical protein
MAGSDQQWQEVVGVALTILTPPAHQQHLANIMVTRCLGHAPTLEEQRMSTGREAPTALAERGHPMPSAASVLLTQC